MANISFSAIVSDAAGSIGGNVFSRGKGGAIVRARRKPVNPRSELQNTRRARTAFLAKAWSATLTAQERADWSAYAAGTSWTNKLGASISASGNSAFMRLNTLAFLYSSTVITAAPLAMGHAGGVTLSFTAENDTGKIQLAEPGGAFDKSMTGHFLMISMGLPSEAGRLSIPKGIRYVSHTAGNTGAPPAYPLELSAAYTMAEGQLITIKAMFQDEMNRVSGPFFATATAAPSI
ncbi:MAG TPA: hypothetical protein VM223_16465 [Planctomycetota bacterium]|nr:hypothetical protein [Planctomycetota bacterium]